LTKTQEFLGVLKWYKGEDKNIRRMAEDEYSMRFPAGVLFLKNITLGDAFI